MEYSTADNVASGGANNAGAPGEDAAAPASLLAPDDALGGEPHGGGSDSPGLVPDSPAGYEIAFAEGTQVDTALLDGFKATAHELGLPQGQAQKLAEFYAGQAVKNAEAAQAAHTAALDAAQGEWEAEIKARPGFKQELTSAKRTLKEFGGPELAKIMNQTRLGSHPVFFDFMARVGKALAEPASRGAGRPGGRERPLMDRLWPDK